MEELYDELEYSKVRFVGLATEDSRYDFGIVYTNKFFGKPLVICMQTGRSTLLNQDDLQDYDFLQKAFNIPCYTSARNLSLILDGFLPHSVFDAQY